MRLNGYRTYHRIERVHFGPGSVAMVPGEVERLGAGRVFMIVSRTLDRSSDVVRDLRSALGARHAGSFDTMPAHTPRDGVVEAAARARAVGADLVLTVGGGTVMDAGQLLRLCIEHDVTSPDQLDAYRTVARPDGTRHLPDYAAPRMPQIAVATTLSAGEFNPILGCTDTRRGVKDIYTHPGLAAQVVVLDAAVTRHTPQRLWLSTGIRALDHAVETICSPKVDDYSMGPAIHAVRLLVANLPRTRDDTSDLEARHRCMMAAWLSADHNMAFVPMGASHGVGHMLGGALGVPHGETSCVMLPATLRFNAAHCPEAQDLVSSLMGRPGVPAWQAVRDFVAELGLPTTMEEIGVTRAHVGQIAAASMQSHYVLNNPRRIRSEAEVVELLSLAFAGA